MESDDEIQSVRIVFHCEEAETDLSLVFLITAEKWGVVQARRYLNFLLDQIELLSHFPGIGQKLEEHSDIYVYLAKIRPQVQSHGHRIFYRIINDRIEIVRVLHSAADWSQGELGG
jgi:toxin ParE1/3/4